MSFLDHITYSQYLELKKSYAQTAAINVDPVNVTRDNAFKKLNQRERNLIMNLCHTNKIYMAAKDFSKELTAQAQIHQNAVQYLVQQGRINTQSSIIDFITVHDIDLPSIYLGKFRDTNYLRRFPDLAPKMQAAANTFVSYLNDMAISG